MQNIEPNTPKFYLSEADGRSLLRTALALHADLLPSWATADEKAVEFGATMLRFGAPENIVFMYGRPFARALVPLLEEAKEFELAEGMRSALVLSPSVTDDEGLSGIYLDHMNTPE